MQQYRLVSCFRNCLRAVFSNACALLLRRYAASYDACASLDAKHRVAAMQLRAPEREVRGPAASATPKRAARPVKPSRFGDFAC